MTRYATTLAGTTHAFADLRTVLAKASADRSGDRLAGLEAETDEERLAAREVVADLPLSVFLQEMVIPYESDEVTRLIVDTHDQAAFAPVAHLTVGGLRDWLLSYEATPEALTALASGLTPEMAAAVSKLMRNQDLVHVARKPRSCSNSRIAALAVGDSEGPSHAPCGRLECIGVSFGGVMVSVGDV
jgi:ethanolamine ammonia-lyase large subunit